MLVVLWVAGLPVTGAAEWCESRYLCSVPEGMESPSTDEVDLVGADSIQEYVNGRHFPNFKVPVSSTAFIHRDSCAHLPLAFQNVSAWPESLKSTEGRVCIVYLCVFTAHSESCLWLVLQRVFLCHCPGSQLTPR